MNIEEIIDDERIDLAMQLDMLSETELNIIDFALERIEDVVMKRIAELEEQNRNMMALLRDFYETEFNRDECWEIIKKYGGDA